MEIIPTAGPCDLEIPVLIAGGGITGLSALLFLQQHGIPALLVERHVGTSIHPRARGVNTRTMELYRKLGLEEAIETADAALSPSKGIYEGADMMSILERESEETGAGFPFDRAEFMRIITVLSPTHACRCTQNLLEPLLADAARRKGGDLRFYTELRQWEQDGTGVTAVIADRHTGHTQTVRAAYLIAADGARSPIRNALQATVSGRGTLGHYLNIYFEANLADEVKGREFSICILRQRGFKGLLAAINNSDRWVFHLHYNPSRTQPSSIPFEEYERLVRLATGVPELKVRIISVLPWEAAVRVADAYRHGRIFLAGDAAHLMPPWAGQGANSGVQDAHNLAWKLAAVLKQQATDALLYTYQTERHPVGRAAAELSGDNSDEEGMLSREKAFSNMGNGFVGLMGFDFTYQSAAIIDSAAAGDKASLPEGRPGTRVPHLWIEEGGVRRSTTDLAGEAFLLLAGAGGQCWREAAHQLNGKDRPVLQTYTIGEQGDLTAPQGQWEELAGITGTGVLLVRPDGFVAWRCKSAPPALEKTLQEILERVLGH